MAAGDSYRSGWATLLQFGEETTLGTYATGTSSLDPLNVSLNVKREKTFSESLNGTRDPFQVFQGIEVAEGSVECYLNVSTDAPVLLLKHALGGTVTSAVSPPATITSTGRLHTLFDGDGANNAGTSTATNKVGLSAYVRYGETTSNAMGYRGLRVNKLTISGEMGQPVKMTAELVGVSGTICSYSTPAVNFGSQQPLLFNQVTIGEADNVASISSATTLKFQSFELTINNNVVSDDDARSLGSRVPDVLPFGKREIGLTLKQRFDTTTNWSKFLDHTTSAIRLSFVSGVTLTSDVGATTYACHIDLPHCAWSVNSPEVGDAGIISQDITVMPYRLNTSTNYAIRAQIHNLTASYY